MLFRATQRDVSAEGGEPTTANVSLSTADTLSLSPGCKGHGGATFAHSWSLTPEANCLVFPEDSNEGGIRRLQDHLLSRRCDSWQRKCAAVP
jgi:hypothetical protein